MALKNGSWYRARVEAGARFGRSRMKQTAYISVPFVLIDEENTDTIEGQFYCTPNTLERTYEAIKPLGFDLKKDPLDQLATRIEGSECEVELQMQEYRGEQRIRVNSVRAVGARGIDDNLLFEIASLFGNTATAAAEPEKQEAVAAAADDNIPF